MAEIIITALIIALILVLTPSLRKLRLRDIIFVAVIAALASGGRLLTQFIAGVQPASFIIIMCGMMLGPGAGMACGLITAVLSSLLTSVGPWTVWQALLWSLMGASGAILRGRHVLIVSAAGLLWGFVFGWVMNLWFYTMGVIPFTLATFLAACAASFYFDLAHAVCNGALLLVFSSRLLRLTEKLTGGVTV